MMMLVAAQALAAPRAPLDRPNVIMLFVDDLGYGDVGFNGHPTTLTPQIDALAWGGKVLTTWYSACPVCSCSRASLLTGRQWARMAIPGVFGPTTPSGLPLNETTLATQLKGAGYTSGIVGKWHLGQRKAYLPAARGFDSYLGIPYSDDMGRARASPCARPTSGMSRRPGAKVEAEAEEEDEEEAEDVGAEADGAAVMPSLAPYVDSGFAPMPSATELSDPAGGVLPLVEQKRDKATGEMQTRVLEQPTDLTKLAPKYASYAADFVHENKDRPFFLYMPFSHVHTTAAGQPARQYCDCAHKNATRRGPFGDALLEVDEIVGEVRRAVEAAGIAQNTLLLFTGDNGPWLIQGASGGSTGLLSGRFAGYWNVGKGSTWEGGIREAGFAYWPGVIKPFTRSAEVISSLDVFPTVLKLAGVAPPSDRPIDGADFSQILLHDAAASEHEILWFYGIPHGAMGNASAAPVAARYGPFKAHWQTGPGIGGCSPSPAAPAGCPTKLYPNGPLLFNVEVDPSEAYPLCANTTSPADPRLAAVVRKLHQARARQIETLRPHASPPAPDGPGEGPGRYGICCNRTLKCDCDDAA